MPGSDAETPCAPSYLCSLALHLVRGDFKLNAMLNPCMELQESLTSEESAPVMLITVPGWSPRRSSVLMTSWELHVSESPAF